MRSDPKANQEKDHGRNIKVRVLARPDRRDADGGFVPHHRRAHGGTYLDCPIHYLGDKAA